MKPVASPWMPSTPAIPATSACRSAAPKSVRCFSAKSLRYCPDAPKWLNRDRFILSAGHGSMFLYSWLHLSGYAVSRDDVKNFRQLHSITPGHPEFQETPGVEATTGPLGQGVGNAVGLRALRQTRRRALQHRRAHDLRPPRLRSAGDGCLQEGVAKEAIAFAGHNGLDNLILIYDSNDVTLDAMAEITQSEDAEALFHSRRTGTPSPSTATISTPSPPPSQRPRPKDNGRPKVIIAKTLIGKGIPEVAGTAKGHGEGGAKFIDAARAGLGLPADEHFYVSAETQAFFAAKKAASKAAFDAWQTDLRRLGRGQSRSSRPNSPTAWPKPCPPI